MCAGARGTKRRRGGASTPPRRGLVVPKKEKRVELVGLTCALDHRLTPYPQQASLRCPPSNFFLCPRQPSTTAVISQCSINAKRRRSSTTTSSKASSVSSWALTSPFCCLHVRTPLSCGCRLYMYCCTNDEQHFSFIIGCSRTSSLNHHPPSPLPLIIFINSSPSSLSNACLPSNPSSYLQSQLHSQKTCQIFIIRPEDLERIDQGRTRGL